MRIVLRRKRNFLLDFSSAFNFKMRENFHENCFSDIAVMAPGNSTMTEIISRCLFLTCWENLYIFKFLSFAAILFYFSPPLPSPPPPTLSSSRSNIFFANIIIINELNLFFTMEYFRFSDRVIHSLISYPVLKYNIE